METSARHAQLSRHLRVQSAYIIRLAAVMGSIVCGASTGCYDALTAPQRARVEPARPRFSLTPDTSKNSPNAGSWSGVVDAWDGGSPTGPSWHFALPTIVVVRIAGVIEQGDGVLPGNHYTWGPTGNLSNHGGAIGYQLANDYGSYNVWPGEVDTVVVQDNMLPFRAGVINAQPENWPRTDLCGMYNSQTPRLACYTYFGESTLAWRRPHVDLVLTRLDSGEVQFPGAATFTVASAIATIGAHPVPVAEIRWHWLPDYDMADDIAVCQTAGTMCSFAPLSSGTMFVEAYVNGEWSFKGIHVDVTGSKRPIPCRTIRVVADSYPEIASAKMDSIKAEIWRKSRLTDLEYGGFVVPEGTDYTLDDHQLTPVPCGISAPPGFKPPVGALADIHPHTRPRGEDVTLRCKEMTGRTVLSAGDSASLPDKLSTYGYSLPRDFIITQQHIMVFKWNVDEDGIRYLSTVALPRCGY